MDVSTGMGLLVIGGIEGKLLVLDPYAYGVVNFADAHKDEILEVFIHDE